MRDAVGLGDELAIARTGGERMQRARDRLLCNLRERGGGAVVSMGMPGSCTIVSCATCALADDPNLVDERSSSMSLMMPPASAISS